MANERSEVWTSPLLAREAGLAHAVTQRGRNMALTVGADTAETVARRRKLCDALSLSFDKLTVGQQVHGAGIAVVTGDRVGCGRAESQSRVPNVDGMVTDDVGTPLMALSADCCLVLVYDPNKRAVGVAHAGWRGTARGVAQALLRHMGLLYECQVESLLAAVSPCAGVCCYEVKEDAVSTFAAAGQDTASIVEIRDDAMFLDLAKANAMQLQAGGLKPDRIDVAGVCTICDERYYSHRRSPGEGQFALIAALR